MKYWVGTTDNDWYQYLSRRELDEVNFWQPSAKPPFNPATTPVGLPFLFKLKRPNNHVAGGGFFVTYSTLPIPVAWDVFGDRNGAASLDELYSLLLPLNGGRRNGLIGCTVLADTSYLPPDSWIDNPPEWAGNIVRGRTYDTETEGGARLWKEYVSRLQYLSSLRSGQSSTVSEKFGSSILVKPRVGQVAFRVLVTDAYKRRCAITGENTLVALEAAHIVPYSQEGTHEVHNGLLLRADFHKLYDVGLVGVTPDLRVRISPRIRESYFNGKSYYRLDERSLVTLPDNPEHRPDRDRLDWHMRNRFQD